MDILHSKVKQGKEDNNGLLLIPGDVVNDRKIIYIIQTEYFL